MNQQSNLTTPANDFLLRDVQAGDLPVFFANQLDPVANQMAAFTAKDTADRAAFDTHWARIMADDAIIIKTIVLDGQVAGSILSYEMGGEREVSYWLGRKFWGKGLATRALAAYLKIVTARPLYARIAKDNIASRRVLEKNGFTICGEDRGFANARGEEIEEFILKLP